MFAIGLENRALYLAVMLLGAALALGLGWYRCARAGVDGRRVVWATVLLPLCTMFFSHLLYCMVDIEYTLYSYGFGYLLAFWEPGGMLYGGILGGALALALAGGKERDRLFEQYAPSGAWMIAVLRMGEGMMGQGYGEYAMEENALCRFPFMVYDTYYEEWAWALFLAEALVALGLCLYLLCRKKTWQGDGALLLLGLMASAQIILESLRRDEFLRWGFVRVEQLLSAVTVLAVLLCYARRDGRGQRLRKGLCLGAFLAMIVFCILLEFATEGRIAFLSFLDVNACYIAMALSCVVIAATVLWMRRMCNAQYLNDGKEQRI